MITPDRKVRKLMEAYQETGKVSVAALRADLDRKTARKYLEAGAMPSERERPILPMVKPSVGLPVVGVGCRASSAAVTACGLPADSV